MLHTNLGYSFETELEKKNNDNELERCLERTNRGYICVFESSSVTYTVYTVQVQTEEILSQIVRDSNEHFSLWLNNSVLDR